MSREEKKDCVYCEAIVWRDLCAAAGRDQAGHPDAVILQCKESNDHSILGQLIGFLQMYPFKDTHVRSCKPCPLQHKTQNKTNWYLRKADN